MDPITHSATSTLLNKSLAEVHNLVRSGTLEEVSLNGRTWISAESVARVVAKPDSKPGLGELMRAMAVRRMIPVGGDIPDDVKPLLRVLDGLTSPSGGALIAPQYADEVFRRVRSFEPLTRTRWYFTTARELEAPVTTETSRIWGARLGGAIGRWDATGIASPDLSAALVSQPTLSAVKFFTRDLTVYGPKVSEDLLRDGPLMAGLLADVATEEIAYMLIERIFGVNGTTGVLTWPATIAVTRTGANAIVLADFQNMFQRCWGASRSRACWFMNADSYYQVLTLATTSTWAGQIFTPTGAGGNPYPLLLGRPILEIESCPAVGTSGDVVLMDPSQIGICIHTPNRKGRQEPGAVIDLVDADTAQALLDRGLERRDSGHRFWENDQHIFMTRLRADVKCLWPTAVTQANVGSAANTASPVVILSK